MDKSEHYKKLRDEAWTTVWILYAAAFVLGLITFGTGIPISLILFAIGQCYYAPKGSKYNQLYEQELDALNSVYQGGSESRPCQGGSQDKINKSKKRLAPEDLI